jgi:hypothetical protein
LKSFKHERHGENSGNGFGIIGTDTADDANMVMEVGDLGEKIYNNEGAAVYDMAERKSKNTSLKPGDIWPPTGDSPIPVDIFDLTYESAFKGPDRNQPPEHPAGSVGYQLDFSTVRWEEATRPGIEFTGTCSPYGQYTWVINLTAKDGYTFDGVPASSFIHRQADLISNAAGSGQTMVLRIAFTVTAD